MTRLLTLLVVLGLLAGACGNDDDTDTGAAADAETETEATETDTETDAGDATDEDYAVALAEELQSGGGFPGERDQVECVAGAFVDSLGGAVALQEAGVTPQDLAKIEDATTLGIELDEDEVADELVVGFEDCDYDLIALLTESLGAQAPEGFEACVREQVSNDDIARVFARLMLDPADQSAGEELSSKLEVCVEPAPAG